MNQIIHNPKILCGKPIIKGTRISVEFILELLASGMDAEEIIKEYPRLKRADIFAAVKYAVYALKQEEFVFTRSL